MASHIRQGIKYKATKKNKNAKYKMSYSYGQSVKTTKTTNKKSLKYSKKITKNGKTKYYYA